ncbi:MAG: type VI secretion system tip protein TssI/VgrG [Minicystis sp.]
MPSSLNLSFANEHDSLSVRHFTVAERMSAPFEITIVALSRLDDIDFETIIGQGASFRIQHAGEGSGTSRQWSGICSHFEQIQAEETGMSTYLVRIVPELWLLSQRQNHRIFQHASIPEIVGKLLTEWRVEHAFAIDAAVYPRFEYRVQYGESDFAFISRLLEEAGIAYHFAFEPDHGSKVVLTDKPHRAEPRAGGAVPFLENPGHQSARDFVTKVRVAREIRPGAVTLRDFDFRGRLTYPLFGKAGPTPGVESPLEQYRYAPNAFVTEGRPGAERAAVADEKEGTALAERTLDALRGPREAVGFETNALDLAPGCVFTVGGHPKTRISTPNALLVIEQRIDGTVGGQWSIASRAVVADTPWRPAMSTPRPRILGVQAAIVVGPKGDEIYTDDHGRVRVQFPWDREGKHDENSSCWIRVSQGWAGTGFGMIVLPRIGQEVTVGFFEGDPDQPIVIGRVYDALNQVPYKLPDHKTRSGIRTRSSPHPAASPAYNELMFEDKQGAELVSLRAQRDLHKLVKANEVERTGTDRTIAVGKSRTATVGAVDSTYVGQKHSIVVGAAGGQSTSVEMTDRHIVYSTGEATVAFDGPDIKLEAKGNITIVAHEGDVVIRGGPNVKINCD